MKTLNYEQKQAFNTMISGQNVFLTGKAGSGKSYLINTFINHCKKEKRNILICAPTGVAALRINGVTLHRAFQMNFKPQIENPKKLSAVIKNAEILVIDEISMCRIDIFEYVMKVITIVQNKYHKKIQVILVGDFYQLSPVITRDDKQVLDAYYGLDIEEGFAFQSKMWKKFQFKKIELQHIFRQQDSLYIDALNKARIGDSRCIDILHEHCCKSVIKDAIWLVGTNKVANELNEKGLRKLKTPSSFYEADVWESAGYHLNDSDMPNHMHLELKEGARVMVLINHALDYYSNGMLGTIVKLYEDSVDVKFDNKDKVINIGYVTWNIQKYILVEQNNKKMIEEFTIASFTQIPLKLAYAITVHKSQGQTFEKVNYDPYSFTNGQLYVGLSRCTSLDNLYIHSPIKREYMLVSHEVNEFEFDYDDYDFFEMEEYDQYLS